MVLLLCRLPRYAKSNIQKCKHVFLGFFCSFFFLVILRSFLVHFGPFWSFLVGLVFLIFFPIIFWLFLGLHWHPLRLERYIEYYHSPCASVNTFFFLGSYFSIYLFFVLFCIHIVFTGNDDKTRWCVVFSPHKHTER